MQWWTWENQNKFPECLSEDSAEPTEDDEWKMNVATEQEVQAKGEYSRDAACRERYSKWERAAVSHRVSLDIY